MTPWLSQKRTRPALAAPLPHTAPCTAHPPHRQLQDRAEHTPTVHCICPFHGAGPPPPCPPHPRNLQGFHPLLSTPPPSHFIFSDGACTAPLLFLPVMAPAAPGGTLSPPPSPPAPHPPTLCLLPIPSTHCIWCPVDFSFVPVSTHSASPVSFPCGACLCLARERFLYYRRPSSVPQRRRPKTKPSIMKVSTPRL